MNAEPVDRGEFIRATRAVLDEHRKAAKRKTEIDQGIGEKLERLSAMEAPPSSDELPELVDLLIKGQLQQHRELEHLWGRLDWLIGVYLEQTLNFLEGAGPSHSAG